MNRLPAPSRSRSAHPGVVSRRLVVRQVEITAERFDVTAELPPSARVRDEPIDADSWPAAQVKALLGPAPRDREFAALAAYAAAAGAVSSARAFRDLYL
jgi:hypothetical protein